MGRYLPVGRRPEAAVDVGVRLRPDAASGRLQVVDDTERDELRRLAAWLSRRRAVDEAVALLTAYGPTALERVSAHLDALKQLLAAESEAFGAVEAAARRLPQSPLPVLDDASAYPGATVHSLVQARTRSRG